MKRTFTEKLKIVSQALSGVPQRRLCAQYHLGQHYLENLIDRYRKYGEGGLYSKSQKKISSDFKIKLVRDFIEKGVSLRHICNENEISRTAFESWVRKARSHGYDSLRAIKRRGQPPKDMARPKKREPQTELEKLQEPDFDNGSPKSEIRWEQRLQQPMLRGYEHNSGGSCTVGKCYRNC